MVSIPSKCHCSPAIAPSPRYSNVCRDSQPAVSVSECLGGQTGWLGCLLVGCEWRCSAHNYAWRYKQSCLIILHHISDKVINKHCEINGKMCDLQQTPIGKHFPLWDKVTRLVACTDTERHDCCRTARTTPLLVGSQIKKKKMIPPPLVFSFQI